MRNQGIPSSENSHCPIYLRGWRTLVLGALAQFSQAGFDDLAASGIFYNMLPGYVAVFHFPFVDSVFSSS